MLIDNKRKIRKKPIKAKYKRLWKVRRQLCKKKYKKCRLSLVVKIHHKKKIFKRWEIAQAFSIHSGSYNRYGR